MVGGHTTNRGWLQEGVIRGSMLGKTILPTDEELGKKDDDHKPGAPARVPAWSVTKTPMRWRRRRIIAAVVGLYLVYLVSTHIPGLNFLSPLDRPPGSRPIVPLTTGEHNEAVDGEPRGPPPGLSIPKDGLPPQTYGGHIKFYRLAASLHGASHTHGYNPTNRNVLFAISSLKSAATLLPMICDMSKWNRNWVHAAFMGRANIPINDLLEINGVDKVNCPAIWHDARPDYMEYSSEKRAESSVIAAMGHIETFLHPQVTIMDDSLEEDAFFTRGIRSKAKLLDIPIIEVPKDRMQNFLWITRLDAGSLRNWHKPTVDILIQAPSESSGGILRLLKSLKEADYSGLKPPRLTIELPADVDPTVQQYLERYDWPPTTKSDPLVSSQMTIRRRIITSRITQEESAIRFIELFYPTSTLNSHVLLLSPQAQLSPSYFHYLKYILLEYKYSFYGEDDAEKLMGAALELPSVLLDGKSELSPPKPSDMHDDRYSKLSSNLHNAPFLWQAPNSHATLFFGDKWAELHSYLSNRIKKQHQGDKKAPMKKLVSETLPAWTEYMLELMRARGYALFYPSTSGSESFVTVHNELYHPPEEFTQEPATQALRPESTPSILNEPFLRAGTPIPKPDNLETPVIPYSRPLHEALPFDGDLPEIPHLPYLLYNGAKVKPSKASLFATEYANQFRKTVGGCQIPVGKHAKVLPGSAKDLFCYGDDDEWEDDDVVSSVQVDVRDIEATEATESIGATESGDTPTAAMTATLPAVPRAFNGSPGGKPV